MKYLLDTNICIYFLNKTEKIKEKIDKIPSDDISVSLITLAELQFGAYNSTHVQDNLRRVEFFEKTVQTVSLTSEITEEYARIKSKLRKSGRPVDDFDILIGATAIVGNLTLVTNNERHFAHMDGLRLENWITG
ncbi:MAG: type II toxin-antitoxin system VapC family toxin [Oscillospiraceae bacterium]|nr:type II toxin-antitoxin system VapC family toxin [Oscillospiraceae bacterium]